MIDHRSDERRRPAVAGQFYPADPDELRAAVELHLGGNSSDTGDDCVAVVVPHAGYVYSGHVAGVTFARARVARRIVLLGVNHRASAAPLASWARGVWDTPLGPVPIDDELMASIAERFPSLVHDARAHRVEHSLEVEVPFLMVKQPDLCIAPISISCHDLAELRGLGLAIADAVRASDEPVLIVASTDFTHYQPAEVARREDEYAVERIRSVDGPGLLEVVGARDISMCGVAPTTVALVAATALGATAGELVRYANSGDLTGDMEHVVAYAGFVIR